MTPIDVGMHAGAPRAADEARTVANHGSLVDDVRTYARRAFLPVDAAWLAVFRAMLGVLLGVSMQRFLAYGWVDELLVSPRFRFHYWGFSWVEPLTRTHMHALFWALSALGIAVAAGFAYRVTAPLFALGLTYVQLLDVSTYLNHYYLAALLAWLLAFSPAGRSYSVDAWIAAKVAVLRTRADSSRPSRLSVPRPSVAQGWLWLFRLQIAVVYASAALAKLQPDWLLHGQPLGIWLGARTSVPVLGKVFTWPYVPLAMSWAGFLFDATIVLFLSRPRTRKGAFVVVVVFHTLTRVLFDIGMFPFIMTCAVTVFFAPSWPRDLLARTGRALGREWQRSDAARERLEAFGPAHVPTTWAQRASLVAFGLYALVQVLLPLRAFAYGGNVLWHEQGMRFSWRVMVRAKGGSTTFFVKNPRTGKLYLVSPRAYLTPYQENEMASQPDLVLQLAKRIGEDYSLREGGPVEVRAEVLASLNARPGALLIDPEVDLLRVEDGLARAPWILPAPNEPPPPIRPVL